MSRGKSSQDFGILESKALVIFLLASAALSACGVWKVWELVSKAMEGLF